MQRTDAYLVFRRRRIPSFLPTLYLSLSNLSRPYNLVPLSLLLLSYPCLISTFLCFTVSMSLSSLPHPTSRACLLFPIPLPFHFYPCLISSLFIPFVPSFPPFPHTSALPLPSLPNFVIPSIPSSSPFLSSSYFTSYTPAFPHLPSYLSSHLPLPQFTCYSLYSVHEPRFWFEQLNGTLHSSHEL